MIEVRPAAEIPDEAIEALLDAAFGDDRRGRTAYRLREGLAPIAELSIAVAEDGRLLGSLQSWPVVLTAPEGATHPLVMVGPVAVRPELQGKGVGKRMLREAADRLDSAGLPAMLIGDEDYYGPFGFVAGPASGWTLPGPVEPHRILLRASRPFPARGGLAPDLLRSRPARPS